MPALVVNPKTINIEWDRTGSIPELSDVTLSAALVGSASGLDIEYSYENTSLEWLGLYRTVDDFNNVRPYLDSAIFDMPNGTYKGTIFFTVYDNQGGNAKGFLVVNLILSGAAGIKTDKNVYNITFNRANNTLTGDTLATILNNIDATRLTFWQPTSIFEPKTGFTDSFIIEDNSTISLAANLNLPNTGRIDHQCKILGSNSEFITGFAISLLILNDNGIGVNPESLSFEVIKSTTEKTAVLSVINPLGIDFTINAPSWLIPSISSGAASVAIDMTTSTDSLDPGIYNDNLHIVFNGGIIDVPVQLILKQFITIDVADFNFCLDLPPVLFTKITENAVYVKVTLTATYIVMGVSSVVTQNFKIPYINDTAMFELGKKLHNYFPRFRDHLFDIAAPTEFLQAINCNLVLEELNVDYENVLTENLNNLKFFPGSEPAMFPIFSNFASRKKTNKSQFFITHAVAGSVMTEKIVDTDNVDQITYDGQTVNYYDFPKVYEPIHMQWENQNLVPEWFTFTAEYSINAEFTHITSKNVLKSLMEKFETTKIKKLQISTGFILKQEIEMIEEMTENRLAFVKIAGKIYQCYNVTAKLLLQSSSQNIIERDLEFLIVEK